MGFQGRIQDFFEERVHRYFNTNKPHYFCRVPVILKAAVHLREGREDAQPLYPPPRSASGFRPKSQQPGKTIEAAASAFWKNLVRQHTWSHFLVLVVLSWFALNPQLGDVVKYIYFVSSWRFLSANVLDEKRVCLLPRDVFLDLFGNTHSGSPFIFGQVFLLAVGPLLAIYKRNSSTKQRKLL